jgi:hypothetical protein
MMPADAMVQWLKKLPQCLLIMEKDMHYSMMTQYKDLIFQSAIYDIISQIYILDHVTLIKTHGVIK